MVGRRAELRRLPDVFEWSQRDRSCALVTIVGAAGVGKSRLAAEFVDSLDGAAVVRGRCVSYGEGITYWPVVPVLRQLEPRFPNLSLDERVLATLHGLLGSGETMDSTEESRSRCGSCSRPRLANCRSSACSTTFSGASPPFSS